MEFLLGELLGPSVVAGFLGFTVFLRLSAFRGLPGVVRVVGRSPLIEMSCVSVRVVWIDRIGGGDGIS